MSNAVPVVPPAGASPASFKQQMLRTREEAIVGIANRLLAQKGFDAMTVDEVAAAVGIAKANLFQHFPSKEALATAAMVRVMRRALDFLQQQVSPQDTPADKLRSFAVWAMQSQLDGEMPLVPGQRSTLRHTLMNSADYSSALDDVSDTLLGWITAAQADGTLNPMLPAPVVLHSLYARACCPVVDYLKAQGDMSDVEIVEYVLTVCFDGLTSR